MLRRALQRRRDPGGSPWRRRSALLGAALWLGCAGLGGIESLKARLIGVEARELRKCVGVPTGIELSEGKEVLVYRFGGASDILRDGLPSQSPRSVLGPAASGRSGEGFCELSFSLEDGRVASVAVRGRRPSGLNDDAGCLRRAQSCALERTP